MTKQISYSRLIPSLIFGGMTGYLLGNTLLGVVLGAIAGLVSWTAVMIYCCLTIIPLLMADPQSVLALASGFSFGYSIGVWMTNRFLNPQLDSLRPLALFLFTYVASMTIGNAFINIYLDEESLLMIFIISLFFHINRMVSSLNPE